MKNQNVKTIFQDATTPDKIRLSEVASKPFGSSRKIVRF